MQAGQVAWPLQRGRWWFTAELVVLSDAHVAGSGPPAPLTAVEAWRTDARPLKPMRGGWVLDVNGACRVELRLTP